MIIFLSRWEIESAQWPGPNTNNSFKVSKILTPVYPDDLLVHGHTYRASAVIQHIGALPNEGHYVAYVRHDNQWLGYNDDAPVTRDA